MRNRATKQILPILGDETASLQLLMSALDSSITGIIITDNCLPDNPIIYCNTSFERLSGYPRAEVIGKNGRFLQGKERDQQARTKIKSAMSKGEATVVEIRNYRKSGEVFWNELHLSPIRGVDGSITHYIGVQHDITHLKHQDITGQQKPVQVQQSTSLIPADDIVSLTNLNTIIQTIPNGLLVLDLNFNILAANRYFLNIFKIQESQVVGVNLQELSEGRWNIGPMVELLRQLIDTGRKLSNFELTHDFPHVGHKLLALNADLIQVQEHDNSYLMLAIEDLTESRAAEERKDDFLAISSHELKTPLTSIKGFNQVLKKFMPVETPSLIQGLVDKSAQQIEKLEQLVREMVEGSRVDGQLTMNKTNIDFNQLVSESVEHMLTIAKDHQIHVSGQIISRPFADAQRLKQVLENLLTNAVKYAPDSNQIYIQLSEVSDYLKFSVTDCGLGISAEDQVHLFEKFFRVNHFQRHFPGMGIGLHVSKQIIIQHGGSLWVDSEPGHGSTFHFTLPI